jgi:hypothetical protein
VASTSLSRKVISSKTGEFIVGRRPGTRTTSCAIKGVEALAALPGQRDPGGLPAAGREDQRQAHRGDRSPDAAARSRSTTRGETDFLPRASSLSIAFEESTPTTAGPRRRKPAAQARRCSSASPRPRLRPSRSSRRRRSRRPPAYSTEAAVGGKMRRPARPQGERHHRSPDSRRYGWHDDAP